MSDKFNYSNTKILYAFLQKKGILNEKVRSFKIFIFIQHFLC